jgi:hypothetical protein
MAKVLRHLCIYTRNMRLNIEPQVQRYNLTRAEAQSSLTLGFILYKLRMSHTNCRNRYWSVRTIRCDFYEVNNFDC